MNLPPRRILLVDDHAVVREGIRSLLDPEPDLAVAGEVGSAEDALRFVATTHVDLVTFDLRMPGMPAEAAVRTLRASHPALRILVLTSFFVDAEVRAVLAAGAAGYVLKDARREEILTAVRAVLDGDSWIHPPLQGRVLQLLRQPPPAAQLTPREREVLDLLGKGLSNKRIALALGLTEGTVKSYLRQIFPKIKAADRLQAALYARGLAQAGREPG
jgi:DNA-binding NarL/FixJ family response regulator